MDNTRHQEIKTSGIVCVLYEKQRAGKIARFTRTLIYYPVMVVVGFSGSLVVFWRLFFLTFHQSLWLAASEDRNSTLCSGAVCLGVEYLWLWDQLLSFSGDGWLWWSMCFCCGCIVVIRRRDYLSLWLMGVVSWSFVCSDHRSLWLGRVRRPFAGCIFQYWEPSFVEF